MADRFLDALAAAGVEVEVSTFPEGTRTAADAATAVGCDVAQIVKSLVFLAGDKAVMGLLSGADRLDTARLAALLGERAARADADTVRRVSGYAIGGVPPFGHATALRVYMDDALLAHDLVWAAAGRPDRVFAIDPVRLAELSRATVVRLRE